MTARDDAVDPLARLAGSLRVFPGRALPNIASSRAEFAPRLAAGRPAQAVPDLLAAVFTLCGGAQRLTAQAAIAAARGAVPPEATQHDTLLRTDTAREHLRRLWLDWPVGLGVTSPPHDAAALGAAIAAAARPDDGALADWLTRHALGEPADAWLARWCDDPAGWLAAWSTDASTLPARVLRAAQVGGLSMRAPPVPLHVHAQRGSMADLLPALRGDAGFALAPRLDGLASPETGPWTRLADPLAAPGSDAFASVWVRLGARLAELVRLSLAGGAGWLRRGALAAAPGEGLAWTESARGLLVHWVRLRADASTVDRWRVVAPTEWNFHPHGPVAHLLARLRDRGDGSRVRLLAAAFDPCVSLQPMPAPETADA